jgi:hypothetical protein
VTKWQWQIQWQLQKSIPKLVGVQKICQSNFSSDSFSMAMVMPSIISTNLLVFIFKFLILLKC